MNVTPELVTALSLGFAGVLAAIVAAIASLRGNAENKRSIAEVHVLVNERFSKLLDQNAQLAKRVADLSGRPSDEREAEIAVTAALPSIGSETVGASRAIASDTAAKDA